MLRIHIIGLGSKFKGGKTLLLNLKLQIFQHNMLPFAKTKAFCWNVFSCIVLFILECLEVPPGPSLMAQMAKCLSAMRETWVWTLGWEDALEKEMSIHSSTLAWKIPWTEEPGRLQSMGLQRVGHDWVTSVTRCFLCIGLSDDFHIVYCYFSGICDFLNGCLLITVISPYYIISINTCSHKIRTWGWWYTVSQLQWLNMDDFLVGGY